MDVHWFVCPARRFFDGAEVERPCPTDPFLHLFTLTYQQKPKCCVSVAEAT